MFSNFEERSIYSDGENPRMPGHTHTHTPTYRAYAPGATNVYDSSRGSLFSPPARNIVDLMIRKESTTDINIADVQWQKGENDCGVYAIA